MRCVGADTFTTAADARLRGNAYLTTALIAGRGWSSPAPRVRSQLVGDAALLRLGRHLETPARIRHLPGQCGSCGWRL